MPRTLRFGEKLHGMPGPPGVVVDDLPSQQPALTLVGGRAVHDPDGLLGSPGSA